MPLRQGGPEAIVFFDSYTASLFERGSDGHWQKTGIISGRTNSPAVREGFEKGDFKLQLHDAPDIVIGDQTLTVLPFSHVDCALSIQHGIF